MSDLEKRTTPTLGDDHPVELLRADHAVVLGVLDKMEVEALRLSPGAPIRETFWQNVLAFHAHFHDRIHHHKEEILLFTALEATGLSPTSGPTAVLRAEHERCRVWRQRIAEALRHRDAVRLQAATLGCLEFQRQHIRKEDQILFPLAGRLLPPAEVARLQAAFRAFDAEEAPVPVPDL